MQAALGGEVSVDTVRSRLKELDEREVLKSETANNGDIYWLNRQESDWGIPPDTELEAKDSDITLEEWKSQPYVQVAALSVFLTIVGTAITLLGTFQAGGFYSLPIASTEVIAVGLTLGILTYFGLFLAGLIWVFESSESSSMELPDLK